MMARWWSLAPSTITGLNITKGQITEGYDADLLVHSCLARGTMCRAMVGCCCLALYTPPLVPHIALGCPQVAVVPAFP